MTMDSKAARPGSTDCVMLAAGESTRMGTFKLMLPTGGATVIESSVANALAAGCRVLLVVGHQGEQVRELFAGRDGVTIVENPEYRRGMFSSIRVGVSQVRTGRFFIALGDMPLIEPGIFRLLTTFDDADAVRPTFDGRKGHPVLMVRDLIDTIRKYDDSRSMSDVLSGRVVREVPVSDRSVLYDVDTPADYAELPDAGGE